MSDADRETLVALLIEGQLSEAIDEEGRPRPGIEFRRILKDHERRLIAAFVLDPTVLTNPGPGLV